MLFIVLALLILVFYLIKRFSTASGGSGGKNLIKVLATHHMSPKEKLVLVKVVDETILVGVTSANISKLKVLDKNLELHQENEQADFKFSDFLTRKLTNSLSVKKVEQEEAK